MDADRLESELRALAAEDDSSGVVLIVREGADLVEIVWGLANRGDAVPVVRETRFGVASVSKMFTAAAVGRLVDAGKLSFDSPLVDCLPAELRPRDLDERVTLHHLLTHTSGLSDYSSEEISSEATESSGSPRRATHSGGRATSFRCSRTSHAMQIPARR